MNDTEQSRYGKTYDRIRYSGNRELVIQRDGGRCVKCGMTRQQHRRIFNRDITVDHIDGRGYYTPVEEKNNDLSNLQTLCLICHGQKDTVRGRVRAGRDHSQSKLTEEAVKYIASQTERGAAEMLAKMYGVDPTTIRRVQRGQRWNRVTGLPADKLVDKRRAKRRAERLNQLKKEASK